jgi:hypothetical protein
MLDNITNLGALHRLRGAVDSLTSSTLARVASGRLVALINGRNRAAKSRRYVEYRYLGGGPDLPSLVWNTWRAIALPHDGETLPAPPPVFGRVHEWVPLQVPGAFIAPVLPVFRDWLGTSLDWVRLDTLVRVYLLDPILIGWGEDGSPIYQSAADQPMPGWWDGNPGGEFEISRPALPIEES